MSKSIHPYCADITSVYLVCKGLLCYLNNLLKIPQHREKGKYSLQCLLLIDEKKVNYDISLSLSLILFFSGVFATEAQISSNLPLPPQKKPR